jgi:hypothetical protein
MRTNYTKRLFFDFILVFSLFYLPWWLTSILGMCFVLIFVNPFEVLVIGIFLDSLYGEPNTSFWISHVFFALSSLWILVSLWLKEFLIFKV